MTPEPPHPSADGGETATTRKVMISNRRGLHARAASRFAKVAGEFDAEITVSRGGQNVPGTSILGLMMLAAADGSEIEINAHGTQAEAAIEALSELVESGFEED